MSYKEGKLYVTRDKYILTTLDHKRTGPRDFHNYEKDKIIQVQWLKKDAFTNLSFEINELKLLQQIKRTIIIVDYIKTKHKCFKRDENNKPIFSDDQEFSNYLYEIKLKNNEK